MPEPARAARKAARAAWPATLIAAFLLVACTSDDPASTATGASQPGAATTAPAATPSASEDGRSLGGSSQLLPRIVDEVQPSIVSVLRSDGGEGSGVIWSADGTIVTNHHVVAGADVVEVAFADGQRVSADVVASDPRTDVAVLRADRDGLPGATFARALPEVGELALAMGNPIGFENSVTQGIVSGLHRSIPGSARQSAALVDLIQTDAAISPGNSGGALVNARAEVIGLNVAYIPPNSAAGAVSLGFAIPAATVSHVVEQLLEDGTVEHPYLGIQPRTLTASVAQQLNVDATAGVVVLAVERGGPAATAGVEPGDVITAIGGEAVDSSEDLLGALRGHAPGDEVTIAIVRGSAEREINVTLGELPPVG